MLQKCWSGLSLVCAEGSAEGGKTTNCGDRSNTTAAESMIKALVRLAAGFALLLVFTTSMMGAVSLSISPSILGNSYTGLVSLTISGLNSGETVDLDQYLDLNANKVMVTRFELTDGMPPSISGIFNSAIPADQDYAKNGQVVLRIPFRVLDEASRVVGTHRFRLLSPVSRFSAFESSMVVTQAPSSQIITGAVFTATQLETHAIVALFSLRNELVSAAVSDAKGNYSISVSPGEYRIVACAPGRPSIGSFSRLSVFDLPFTQKLNLTNQATSRTISGTFRNAASGKTLPGVQFLLLSSDGLASLGYSDTNGTFSVGVVPGNWTLVPLQLRLGQLGCNASSQPILLDTTSSDVATNISFPGAASIVHGSLTGPNGESLAGVRLYGTNSSTVASVVTDLNGAFATGVAGAPDWYWQPDPVALARLGYLSKKRLDSIPTNIAWNIDFQARPLTSKIRGRIVMDDGSAVSDLSISASALDDTATASFTKPDGSFELGACGDDWVVAGNPADLNNRGLLQPSTYYSIADGITTNITIVLRRITSHLTVRVQNANGQPFRSAPVACMASIGGDPFILTGSTDSSGQCVLNLCAGDWTIQVSNIEPYGFESPSSRELVVSNVNVSLDFIVKPLMPMGMVTTTLPPAVIGASFNFQMQAAGGAPPYIWMLIAGDLPPGLFLDSSGLISGTPFVSTNSDFTIVLTDNGHNFQASDFKMATFFPISLTQSLNRSKNSFEICLSGELNRPYVLETARKIEGPWRAVLTNSVKGPADIFGTVPVTNSPAFYRARLDY